MLQEAIESSYFSLEISFCSPNTNSEYKYKLSTGLALNQGVTAYFFKLLLFPITADTILPEMMRNNQVKMKFEVFMHTNALKGRSGKSNQLIPKKVLFAQSERDIKEWIVCEGFEDSIEFKSLTNESFDLHMFVRIKFDAYSSMELIDKAAYAVADNKSKASSIDIPAQTQSGLSETVEQSNSSYMSLVPAPSLAADIAQLPLLGERPIKKDRFSIQSFLGQFSRSISVAPDPASQSFITTGIKSTEKLLLRDFHSHQMFHSNYFVKVNHKLSRSKKQIFTDDDKKKNGSSLVYSTLNI